MSTPAAGQGLSGGVVVGLDGSTFANFRDLGPAAFRREVGLLVGVYVELPLGRVVALQPEVVYVQKGTSVEGPAVPGGPVRVFLTERFDYIEVPILVRLGAVAGRRGVYALAGPAVAGLVRAHERFDVAGVPTLEQDVKDGVTSTDGSLVVGAGFSIRRLGVEGRADVGVRSLIPPVDRRPGDGEPSPRNRSLCVVVRVRV